MHQYASWQTKDGDVIELSHAEETLLRYIAKMGEIDPDYDHLLGQLMDDGIVVFDRTMYRITVREITE